MSDNNVCAICGKRTAGLTDIHTCTPPVAADSEAFYGFPHGPASSSNAGGKCVTDGETSPISRSTAQEYWDACLIKTWRKSGDVFDAMVMFKGITGINADSIEPRLLRLPKIGFPWRIAMRAFVASHLSKISARLWDQPPEKDIALLRKLQTSKYDTEKDAIADKELVAERKAHRVNQEKMEYTTREISKRNSATDWNVNKGPRR